MPIALTYLNGRTPTAEQLAPLAFAGYTHFTAMQVRDRAARGLDLHLERLRSASDEMFGHHLADAELRTLLADAVHRGPRDSSLTCFVTGRPGEFTAPDVAPDLDVLVRVTDPAQPPAGPLALDAVAHERHLPEIKHTGEVAKTRYLRRAVARGFDDAAFLDRDGRLSEATIWNLAFSDGSSVIWPDAAVLPGVTMQILRRRLAALGVPQETRDIRPADLDPRLSGVVINSWSPGIALDRIGDRRLADGRAFSALLHRAYATEPAVNFD